MAFTNFYIDASGDNLNAGSVKAAAASLTYAGGTFVRATGVFTVASGAPDADGVTVGQWVSVYTTSGAVAATCVGQVTARDATTITIDTTKIVGLTTAVSETAAATTAKVGGSWLNEIVLAATGLGTFTAPLTLPMKINIAGNITITASRTISCAGAATAPLWFSGYNTTPGDLDNDTANSLAKPVWTVNSTFSITSSGAQQTWSGISVVGNRTGTIWTQSGANPALVRLRVENTSSNAGAIAFTANVSTCLAAYCWFKVPATATTTGCVSLSNTAKFIGCVAETGSGTGASGFSGAATSAHVFLNCVVLNGVNGFSFSTGGGQFIGCTVYNTSGDGLRWTGTPTASTIIGCLFSTCGGYGINQGTGTNVNNLVFRSCNDFYACTPSPENGFGDSPAWFAQTDGSAVVTSGTDMTPVVGSNARAHGFPGLFENQAYSSYQNIGAVQQVATTGGGQAVSIFG